MELRFPCPDPNCKYEYQVEIEEEDDLPQSVYCDYCGREFKIERPPHGLVSESARLKWMYPLDPASAGPQPLRNCPAVDSKGRVFACVQNELVALLVDGDEPDVLWKYATGGYIPGSPTIGRDGNVRVHSSDGCLYCVNPDGELCWTPLHVGEPLGWAAPVTDLEANTWLCAYSGGLIKVDPSGSTHKRLYYRSPSKFDSTAFIWDGTLYVGAEDQFVYAIDLAGRRGTNRWNQSENRGQTGWFINTSPVLADGPTIVVASGDDHLYGFGTDGESLWKLKLPGQVLGSPVVDAENRIYIGLSQIQRRQPERGSLVCIDGRSQKIQWVYSANGPVESTPVVGEDGIVYVGDNSGVVHAVDRTGQVSWTQEVGVAIRSAGTLASNLREGRLLFGLENGCLIALECSSARLADGWPKYLGTLEQSGDIDEAEARDKRVRT